MGRRCRAIRRILRLGNLTIPLPIYRLASVGGDTSFTANLEYRIPIVSQVTFAFFTDFDMTFDAQPGQLRQSVAGQSAISVRRMGALSSSMELA